MVEKWIVFSNIIFLSRFFNKILCKKNTGKFSNNGINNFKKHYNWNKITKKYLKFLKNLIIKMFISLKSIIQNYNLKIKGVIHIGAHKGEELS